MLRLILVILYLCILSSTAFAEDEKYIGNIISENAAYRALFVEKATKTLYLVEMDNGTQRILNKVSVLTGEFEGDKWLRGDKKTPEGIYYTVSYMSDKFMESKFGQTVAAKYGIGAYPLNYPNVVDLIEKKTGHGIWVHGLDPARSKQVTEGCVAMENEHLAEISPSFHLGMPVVIAERALFVDAVKYAEARKESLAALDNFIKIWTFGTYDEFKKMVHPSYSSYSAPNSRVYLSKKKYLMEKFTEKTIITENVKIFKETENKQVYDFDQFYCAENMMTYGNKRMYLEDGKIISEEIFSKPVAPYLEKYLSNFLDEWLTAWQNMDVDGYMSKYSPEIKDYGKMKDAKSAIFKKAEYIKVEKSDVEWRIISGNIIEVTFTQKYESKTNSDTGNKKLRLQGCPNGFKIVSEEWSKI